MDGVLACARYSFAPNYYKYCGPDANRSIAAYLQEGVSDPGLSVYLSEFAVLYPYLKLIAHENGLTNPFDPRVVEAYWVGNNLLEHIGMKSFSQHLLYEQHLKKRLPNRMLLTPMPLRTLILAVSRSSVLPRKTMSALPLFAIPPIMPRCCPCFKMVKFLLQPKRNLRSRVSSPPQVMTRSSQIIWITK